MATHANNNLKELPNAWVPFFILFIYLFFQALVAAGKRYIGPNKIE